MCFLTLEFLAAASPDDATGNTLHRSNPVKENDMHEIKGVWDEWKLEMMLSVGIILINDSFMINSICCNTCMFRVYT